MSITNLGKLLKKRFGIFQDFLLGRKKPILITFKTSI